MLAIDSSLIVRYLSNDHPRQSERARNLIDAEGAFVCFTVLLETEWILRSVYGFAASQIAQALRGFAGLPNVTIEAPALVAKALDWMEGGMDFADALHLTKAAGCDGFVTFDRSLVRAANKIATPAVRRV